jgi:hypothetical protein
VKLLAYFKAFLEDTVNLDDTRLAALDTHVAAIVTCLTDDSTLGQLVEDHIPQGSWAHRTIITPVGNHEFDADFLLLLTEVPEWSASPKTYIQQTRAAFRRSSTYRDKVRKKNRCVRIGYASDCHVDVVPHLVLADGRQVIVNYDEDKFEDTNPQGFTDWMKQQDDLAQGNLRKVIRLMKHLRDYKQTFKVPSVILTTLLGERVQAWDNETRYADVPTALKNLMADLDTWLQLYPTMPPIEDPSCPGTFFNHRWDQDEYANFCTKITLYSRWVQEAFDQQDKPSSLAAWQKIFGSDFKAPATTTFSAASTALAPAAPPRLQPAPGEQFIEEKALIRVAGYRATINATVLKRAGFRSGPLRVLRKVGKQRELEFTIATDVPEPFDLFWKVRNDGSEAQQAGQLRGQLIKDEARTRRRTETTLFRGRHYVECYILKDGRLVASAHHDVVIE